MKFDTEVGLKSPKFRRWFRKLFLFYKIKKNWLTRISPQYDTTKEDVQNFIAEQIFSNISTFVILCRIGSNWTTAKPTGNIHNSISS